MKEIETLLIYLNILKLEILICTYADFAKFIYKILDICRPQKNICPGQSEYHNRFFPISVSCTFTFPCLVIYLSLWNYLIFDLGPLAFISMLFINVDIVIEIFFQKMFMQLPM